MIYLRRIIYSGTMRENDSMDFEGVESRGWRINTVVGYKAIHCDIRKFGVYLVIMFTIQGWSLAVLMYVMVHFVG